MSIAKLNITLDSATILLERELIISFNHARGPTMVGSGEAKDVYCNFTL